MAEELTTKVYTRRRGRLTKAQSRGLTEYAPDYHVDLESINGLVGPLGIEIGFGMGEALIEWAKSVENWQLVGVELYQPGIGTVADTLHNEDLRNVRLVEQPAQSVLAALRDDVIDEIRIFFPDPWPKKRHAKRRLIQPSFVAEIARVVKPGGIVRLATDWDPYAKWMRTVFSAEVAVECVSDTVRSAGEFVAATADEESALRSTTKFELRGERLGHDIHDLTYVVGNVAGKNSATTESK